MPRWVFVGERDRELLLDLDTPWSRDVLLDEWRRGSSVTLREALPSPEDLWVTGPEGRFFHQLIVPFEHRPPEPEQHPAAAALVRLNREVVSWRRRDWLYLKIYLDSSSLETVLIELSRVLERASREPGPPWFFVRYTDPDLHLRIRVKLHDPRAGSDFLRSLLLENLAAEPLCQRVSEEPYSPELYRYGGPQAMALLEEHFCADSAWVLELVRDHDLEDKRWRWVVWRLHVAHEVWGLQLEERVFECNAVRAELATRLRLTIEEKRAIGRFVRDRGGATEAVVAETDPVLRTGTGLRARYRESIRRALAGLRDLERNRRLTRKLRPIVRSVIHVGVNRLVDADFLRAEAMAYELLLREYRRRLLRRGDDSRCRDD